MAKGLLMTRRKRGARSRIRPRRSPSPTTSDGYSPGPGAAFEGAVCGVLAAIGGPIVEALLAGVGVFRYADDSNASFGVAPWLPAL